jgi:hypothetical protein
MIFIPLHWRGGAKRRGGLQQELARLLGQAAARSAHLQKTARICYRKDSGRNPCQHLGFSLSGKYFENVLFVLTQKEPKKSWLAEIA